MKSILIERVTNGWIVRPFQPCEGWATGDMKNIWIYTTIEDLQKDLAILLSHQEQGFPRRCDPAPIPESATDHGQ
jgi:hypothetical protein